MLYECVFLFQYVNMRVTRSASTSHRLRVKGLKIRQFRYDKSCVFLGAMLSKVGHRNNFLGLSQTQKGIFQGISVKEFYMLLYSIALRTLFHFHNFDL